MFSGYEDPIGELAKTASHPGNKQNSVVCRE